jgi:RNA polymerase sigma-70 factor (ECF subfamily)
MNELEEHWQERFRKGDLDAFEAVYRTYGDAVYRVCRRMSGCRTEAEDLAQETFVAAFRSRQRFQGRSALGSWLYRIALDCCRSRYRKKSGHELPLTLDAPVDEIDLAGNLALETAIAQLPDRHRESVILVKIEGLEYEEAAKILDVPSGTVKYWVHEAMMKLRCQLRGFEGEA